MVELGWPTYKSEEIRTLKEIKEIFPDGQANEFNWLLLSQKCFHGTSETLEDIEAILLGQGRAKPKDGKWPVTVLVICPRTTVLKWGYVEITLNDVGYLRGLVNSSLSEIAKSQKGNI